MALSASTFSNAGGAVNDLFSAVGAIQQGDLKAKGLNIQAQGIRLQAKGNLAEASNYDLASTLADQNEQFTETSTAIKQAQADRNIYQTIGGERSDISGAGFTQGGTGIYLLRDSAAQGELTKQVLQQQGLITEAGYKEQAQSYTTMANTARETAAGEMDIANQTDQIASDTKDAATWQAVGDVASSIFKGAAAVATLGSF